MDVVIPLEKMSVAEKLRALEQIWADLQRNPADVPVPSWHEDVLRERQRSVDEASTRFVDWEDAKKRLRDQLH